MSESKISLKSFKTVDSEFSDEKVDSNNKCTNNNEVNFNINDLKNHHETSSSSNGAIQQNGSNSKKVGISEDAVVIESSEKTNGECSTKDNSQSEGKDVKEKAKMVGFFQLFRYADKLDILLMLLGTIGAMLTGILYPMIMVIYGNIINLFIDHKYSLALAKNLTATSVNITDVTMPTQPPINNIYEQVVQESTYFCIFGALVLFTGFIQMYFWVLTAERQIGKMRDVFFHSVLQKHIGWFDIHQVGSISSRLATDLITVQNGVADKMALLIQWMTTFVTGYAIGFTFGWKLTLVVVAMAPLMVVAGGVVSFVIRRMTAKENVAYASAGAIADEVLSSIRTVVAFGGESKEINRYAVNLREVKKVGIRKGSFAGLGSGFLWAIIFAAFAIAMWYGTKLIEKDGYKGGQIIKIFMGVVIGSMSLGHAVPNIEALSQARGAAAKLYEIIDEETEIDPFGDEGLKPEKIEGNIRFEDVFFTYPARADVQVLNGVSFDVSAGKTVALVGPSGCGKSTTVQLIQRFYDTVSGCVRLDGHDIKDLNIRWLRQHIGIVSQEPVLFNTTIAENIRFGCDEATEKEIEQAAREANAHSFIQHLPQKYDTWVGERGSQLSGGQKQRIAIARALVSNPKILLLDEATSALDSESESLVQEALEKVSKGRTTLVIAHRLSTIQNADLIVGMNNGEVVEIGTHGELMKSNGLYYHLVINQSEEHDGAENQCNDEEEDGQLKLSFKRQISHSAGDRSFHGKDSIAAEDLTEDEKEPDLPPASLKRIMRLNAPEWPATLFGCFFAIAGGTVTPIFATVIGSVIGNFGTVSKEEQQYNSVFLSVLITGIGIVAAIFSFLQGYLFAISGENLTMRMRIMAFTAMLKQEMAWFDDQKHNVGVLTAQLAADAAKIKGAAGPQLGVVIQALSTMATAYGIAFFFGWKLALVVTAFLPFLIMAGVLQGKFMLGLNKSNKKAIEEGGRIATEALQNIRTVTSLCKEQTFEDQHSTHFKILQKKAKCSSSVLGIAFGISQAILYFCYAASLIFGSWLVSRGEMDFVDVFRVFSALTIGGLSLGRASSFGPDFGKGRLAAASIFALVDRQSETDASSTEGLKPENCSGEVVFDQVQFSYPTRSDVKVLKDFSLQVNPGQTVALVGSSGCGKSTTVQLIDRYYDISSGALNIGGYNSKDLNIQWLRSKIGIVSQEPVLFDMTIRENIEYGDNSRKVPMADIITAAKGANIHNFVQSLPLGYETKAGGKGTQLSGGQKQRVAIARALLRNPKILLLDEATSALDTESEKVVQTALDEASKGRTCIVIAHRLSTIQNADNIVVIQNGQMKEQGTHQELVGRKGFYAMLNEAQKRRRSSAALKQS